MKRFFLISAIASILGSIAALIIDLSLGIILTISGVIILIAILLWLFFPQKFYVSLICFSFAFLMMFQYSYMFKESQIKDLHYLEGVTCEFKGSVIEERVDYTDYYVYYVKTSFIDIEKAPQTVKLILTTSNKVDAAPFDELSGEITFINDFDTINKNLNADGYFVKASGYHCDVTTTSVKPIIYKAIQLRTFINDTFIKNLSSDIEGIPSAMLTGKKNFISDKFYSDVKYTGMAHVLAVSGLHISIICLSIIKILRRVKLGKKITYFLGLLGVIVLAAVAGFSSSVLRSGFMFFVIFLGALLSRKSDILNSLGLAVTLLLILTPYNIFSVSFMFSSAGTLGIALLVPYLNEYIEKKINGNYWYHRLLKYFLNILVVSLSAGLFTMPISLYLFGFYSFIGPLVNIVLTIPVYLFMCTSLVSLVFCNIPIISDILFWIVSKLATIFKLLIEFFAKFKYAGFYKEDELLYVFICLVIIIAFLGYRFRTIKLIPKIAVILSIVILTTSLIGQDFINSSKTNIYIVDSSSPAIVLTRGNHSAIIGTGGNNSSASKIEYIIDSKFIDNVDLLILPSYKEGFIKGSELLGDNLNINEVVSSPKYEIDNSLEITNHLQDYKAKLWGNISIETFENDDEYNILLNINGDTFLLHTGGDIPCDADYILTSDPITAFDSIGKKASYFLFGDLKNTVSYSNILCKKGAKTAISSEIRTIIGTKKGDNELKFRR